MIHNSTFNFKYEDRASASRCNILIESIFNSHILPELEKAISNNIPDGILVELAKLEINIGNISEKEISTNLAHRIRESLEDALQNKISLNKNSLSTYTSSGRQISDNYLIESIEVFLQKGYFPFGMEESFTIDDLITKAIEQNRDELIEIIKKYSHYEPAIRRIAYNLSADTFDLILFALNPVYSKWMIEFRKILSYAKQERNLNQITGAEFLRTINFFILNYLLNETGSAFDKKKFSTSLLKKFLLLNPDFQLLIKAVKKYTANTSAIILINETLAELVAEKNKSLPEDKYPGLDIISLIDFFNSGGQSKTFNRQFLKDEIIQAINDQGKRKLLVARLNKTAINLILELFNATDSKALIKLITSFTEKVVRISIDGISGKEKVSINKLVLYTIIYLNENSIRILDKEEYVLFLIYSAGLNDVKTAKSDAFTGFVQAQENINLKKLHTLINDEQQYPEISGIQKLISKRLGQEKAKKNDFYPNGAGTEEYYAIYSRKIIGYYLDYGQLPRAYFDLNRSDVQSLFRDLIQQKDNFLATQFRKNKDPESLIQRIYSLIVNLSHDDLEEYFIHFFHVEYAILSKIIAEIKQHFTFKADSRIHALAFENELLITALAKSKGAGSSGIFVLSLLQQLNNEIAKDSADSVKLLQHLFSKSAGIPEIDALKISSNAGFKSAIERDLKILVSRLRLTEYGTLPYSGEVQGLIKNLAFYIQVDQKAFLDILQENRENIFQVYTLLKFYLPQNQWNPIEKSLLSTVGFKEDIELFQNHSDVVIEKIKQPELNLIQTFENINLSEPQKLKAFLLLLMNDEVLFKKFISHTTDYQLHPNFGFGSKKIQTYLQQLIAFSPELISGRIDRKFWKSVVLSFGILIYLGEKNLDPITFNKAFKNHLLQKLKAIHEVDLFHPILDKMNSSGSKELQELVEFRQISKIGKLSETSSIESGYPNSSREIHHLFSILKFYAQNGFFPWWAGSLSFPELTTELNRNSQLYPKTFEEIFLQMEKEEHLFEQLNQKIPDSIVSEFNLLISAHSSLKVIWENILRKQKKSDLKPSNSMLKELYFSGDETVLNHWHEQDPLIAGQIKEYLLLSPYFNFRSINPAQWRQTVYEFSLDFYGPEKKEVTNQFHSEFLKYLNSKFTKINWIDTLSTVYQRNKSTFPKGLIPLINIEPASQTKNKEIGNDANNLISTDDEGVEVKIYNAGLILFWPFLTRLFEHISLLKNGAFINHESMNRAVYILQYLGYNDIDFPEYKLVLNKLLVGMLSQDHLIPFITLTDNEKESTQSLLKGLINNWEKVKNSTPEGIQETFLQREGILRFQTDKVRLVVEKKGVDILLESIPWNISLIKLAWMKMPIYVEWI